MIFTRGWWIDAVKRAGRTALILTLPFLPFGTTVGQINFERLALVASLGFVASLVTSLAGLPETIGKEVPLWQAIAMRATKSFFQGVATGIGTATLLNEVDWNLGLQLGITGALGSLVLGLLTALPEAQPDGAHARDVVEIPEDAPVAEQSPLVHTPDVVSGYVKPPSFPLDWQH